MGGMMQKGPFPENGKFYRAGRDLVFFYTTTRSRVQPRLVTEIVIFSLQKCCCRDTLFGVYC